MRHRYVIVGCVAATVLLIVAVVVVTSRYPSLIAELTGNSKLVGLTKKAAFPEIDMTRLSPVQQKIVTLTKQEFETNPDGTKYSEGVHEAWCADFVSWIMKEAGRPYANPNSGSWRIPGTFTLREYYEAQSRFHAANSGYVPKVGDTMLYDNPSPFGQHVNIVIRNDNGVVTTVGGNEPGGIRVVEHTTPDKAGFIGYGVL